MKTSKNISILGCGWLGLPLAVDRINKGDAIKGATTRAAKLATLTQEKINAFHIILDSNHKNDLNGFFEDSEVVILNFPPKRASNTSDSYKNKVLEIIPHITKNQKVLFVSSTSVYQNTNAAVTEDLAVQPEKASGKAVAEVEALLQETFQERLTILRFSGLFGYDRLPGRFLANKKEISNADAPINLIHRDDCIGLINAILANDVWGEIINGCADQHPLRKAYYTEAALKIGLTPPTFITNKESSYKIVSNTKSKDLLHYTYRHPDPLKLL